MLTDLSISKDIYMNPHISMHSALFISIPNFLNFSFRHIPSKQIFQLYKYMIQKCLSDIDLFQKCLQLL